MLRKRKYLRESLERGRCSSGGGGSGPGRAEGHLVHLAEGHHRTMSGEGGWDFPKHSCVLIQLLSTTCQRINNSLSAAEMSLCSDSVNK